MSYPKVPVGELVSLRQGFAINKNTKHHMADEPTALPLLRIADMKDKVQNVFVKDTIPGHFIAKPEDIIYTRTGQVGLVFTDQYGVIHNNCFTVTPNDAEILDRYYLYYVLQSEDFYSAANNLASGAAQPDLPHGAFRSIEIPVPPLKSQQRIAGILKGYDDLIENNQKQIKLLEEAAQRLYKEWFVGLRFPGYETVPIMDGIPEGWSNPVVTDLLEIKYGKDHKTLENGSIPVYGSGGVMRKVNKILHSGESVLIPRKGSLNNILLVSGDFWTIDTMFFSIPRRPNVAKYVYLFLSGVDMYAMNIGAAVPSMTVKILDGMKLLCPAPEILEQFEKVVGPYFSMIESLKKKNDSLADARDLLLPKLMSGEIEV